MGARVGVVRLDFDGDTSSVAVYGEAEGGQWFLVGIVDVGPFDGVLDVMRHVGVLLLRDHQLVGRSW